MAASPWQHNIADSINKQHNHSTTLYNDGMNLSSSSVTTTTTTSNTVQHSDRRLNHSHIDNDTSYSTAPSTPSNTTDTQSTQYLADIRWIASRNVISPTVNHESFNEIWSYIVQTNKVQTCIRELSAVRNTNKSELIKQAKHNFRGMYSAISLPGIRFGAYVVRKVWRQMYESIRVNDNGLEMLKHFKKNNIPYCLLPMHKSHMDYILISYILFASNIFPPHIVAGDNLNMPVVGGYLRRAGAVYIRRAWGDDQLYKAVFSEYISYLINHGHSMECFIEGTRSRTGMSYNIIID